MISALSYYNLAVATLVTIDYFRNMNTKDEKNPVEYFGDVGIHLINYFMNCSSNLPYKLGTLGVNAYRMVDIPARVMGGVATVPNGIALVDEINHFLNTIGTTVAICKPEQQPKGPKLC